MKTLTLSVILFSALLNWSMPANGQNKFLLKGDSLRQAGEMQQAIAAYRYARIKSPQDPDISYNLSCAFSVDGQRDSAFHYLRISLVSDTLVKDLTMLGDPDFFTLTDDPRWQKLEQETLRRYQARRTRPITNERLAVKLGRLHMKDQYWRDQMDLTGKKYGQKSSQMQALWKKQNEADEENLKQLEQEIRQSGWPRISAVGGVGAVHAFLIVQHARLPVMKKYLPEIKRLCEIDEAYWRAYALLKDRIEVSENRPQLYGSQLFYDEKTENWKLYPIKDEANLASRRIAMGLPTMEVYLANWGLHYSPVAATKDAVQEPAPRDTTAFKRGPHLLFQEKSFTRTEQGEFPSGWMICSTSRDWPSNFGITRSGNISAGILADQAALVARDGWFGDFHYKSIGLKIPANGANYLLPDAFTLECSYFMVDSVCTKNGGGEFTIFFKEPKATYKNELNFRINSDGHFEINCAGNDPGLGLNNSEEFETHECSFVRARDTNTAFHRELTGTIKNYDRHSWHKMALSYNRRRLRCWLDGQYLGSIETMMKPVIFSIVGITTFGINQIFVARQEEESDLSMLLSAKHLTTATIRFETGLCSINTEALPFLDELAAWLKENKTARLKITGHADNRGRLAENQLLSRRRAAAIKAMLVSNGADGLQITVSGAGAKNPTSSNATEAGRATNRRVEFELL